MGSEVARSAVALGRELKDQIARLDGEIARLRRDANPSEAERLAERLTALGPETAGEPEDRRQLRELIRRQGDLMTGFAAQLASVEARRAELQGLLRRLWEGAAGLDSGSDRRAGDSGRLRVLCADISRRAMLETVELPARAATEDMETVERPAPSGNADGSGS
jgi:hypothetical protein